MRGAARQSWWARIGRWCSRRWRSRRHHGPDFGDMGTAFGLDASFEDEQSRIEPNPAQKPAPKRGRDRRN